MATTNDPTLDDRIQSLPQELQDIILDFTVAVKPDQTIVIKSKLKAPWQLQINSATRKQNAPIYFGTSKFQTDLKLPIMHFGTLTQWLSAQDSAHRRMITTIRYAIEHDHVAFLIFAPINGWARCYEVSFNMADSRLRALLDRDPLDVLEVNVRVKQADGEVKVVWAKRGDVRKVLAEGH